MAYNTGSSRGIPFDKNKGKKRIENRIRNMIWTL